MTKRLFIFFFLFFVAFLFPVISLILSRINGNKSFLIAKVNEMKLHCVSNEKV